MRSGRFRLVDELRESLEIYVRAGGSGGVTRCVFEEVAELDEMFAMIDKDCILKSIYHFLKSVSNGSQLLDDLGIQSHKQHKLRMADPFCVWQGISNNTINQMMNQNACKEPAMASGLLNRASAPIHG